MSVKIKSVKLISVYNQVREIIGQFQCGFFGISDLVYIRLVDNCLKMTAHDVIGGNESNTVIIDTENDQQSTVRCLSCLFML